ncbi:MAG: hypothetical protein K6G11_07815 [Lachnospiraceae bacterium]|nr:hypothetical protein [Lachnospiraceae bacterium]
MINISISVRKLVEFICRCGSIDKTNVETRDPSILQEGIRAHNAFQKTQGEDYVPEFSLRDEIEFNYGNYRISDFDLMDSEEIYDSGEDPDNNTLESDYTNNDIPEESSLDTSKNLDKTSIQNLKDQEYQGETSDNPYTFKIAISGRADGVWHANSLMDISSFLTKDVPPEYLENFGQELFVIDEIKSTYSNIRRMKAPNPVHHAQAMCYAAIIAKTKELPFVCVRMVYIDLNNKQKKYFAEIFSADELFIWYSRLTEDYALWCHHQISHIYSRNASIRDLEFPFDYRKGQQKFAKDVYLSILRKKKLFAQAPTGLGKTMSTLFPGVHALGAGLVNRIFYLTAKNVTKDVALSAVTTITHKLGSFEISSDDIDVKQETSISPLKTVIISSRENACMLTSVNCSPKECQFANGHFDRINVALHDMLSNENIMSYETIKTYAEKHSVCPYYLAMDAANFADIIICDYNYAFNPDVCLEGLLVASETSLDIYNTIFHFTKKDDENVSPNLFLIDETHNLLDRARDMYSSNLSLRDLTQFSGELTAFAREQGISRRNAKEEYEFENEYPEDLESEISDINPANISGSDDKSFANKSANISGSDNEIGTKNSSKNLDYTVTAVNLKGKGKTLKNRINKVKNYTKILSNYFKDLLENETFNYHNTSLLNEVLW